MLKRVAEKTNEVTSCRIARIERYKEYANPPPRKPSKLFPVTCGVMVGLYAIIGLAPQFMDETGFTFDDANFNDLSDRLVSAIFDPDTNSWQKSAHSGLKVPESLCKK